jgi:predicted  nucleic acid-binding Zn-ribbon protein
VLHTLDKNKLELAKRANSAETTVAEKKVEIRRLEATIAALQAEIESGAQEVTAPSGDKDG